MLGLARLDTPEILHHIIISGGLKDTRMTGTAQLWVSKNMNRIQNMFFPSADGLDKAERAIHEYIVIVWAKN